MTWTPDVEAVDPHDLTEVGVRAALGLWAENTGMVWTQRLAAILRRRPTGVTWRLHFDVDGVCRSMSWPAWDGRGGW